MPYKHTEYKIKKEDDRRRKLTDQQREKIKNLYGKLSQRTLAKMFNVSRRLIQFIGDPSKKVRNLEVRKARGGSMAYYDKEKQRQYMQNNRKYKQELYLNNKLIGQEPKKDSKIVQIEN